MFFVLIRSVLFEKRLRVNFVRHFDARKLLFRPPLCRYLTLYVISINFGYDCRNILKHVLKSYDNFF